MLKVHVHTSNGRFNGTLELSEISDVLHKKDQLLWIDAEDPTVDDLNLLREEFGFHPLAIEDVSHRRQRPKVDLYGDYLFIVFYSLERYEQGKPLTAIQLNIFVGDNYVVTVHDGAISTLSEIKARWEQNHEAIKGHDSGTLAYTILDATVDGYFPLIDDLSEEIESIEELLFGHFDHNAQRRIFEIKKDLLSIRRVVAPERDVLNVLVRRDTPIFSEATVVYFQDVYDHLIRVTEAIDTYRDLMSSALDAYLTISSNRLNQIVKTLTTWSLVLMSIAAIAGIYGMNFVHMPELDWRFGYLWALFLMACAAGGLIYYFRRHDYL